nr:chitobiase/beta-hexosaminidase C-terminal domain-containing protein [Spirosomataceae bacterium]
KYVFAARDRLDSEYDRVRSVHDGRYQYVYNFELNKPKYMDIAFRKQQASMRDILRLRDAGQLNEVQMQWFLPTKPQEEFYDIQADPHQIHNLANDPRYAKELARFRKVFRDWQKTVPDLGAVPEKELVKQMWNGANKPPQTTDPVVTKTSDKVSISCTTEGASIAYKIIGTDGVEPKRWEVYTKPFAIASGAKVKTLAQRIGYQVSQTVEK